MATRYVFICIMQQICPLRHFSNKHQEYLKDQITIEWKQRNITGSFNAALLGRSQKWKQKHSYINVNCVKFMINEQSDY